MIYSNALAYDLGLEIKTLHDTSYRDLADIPAGYYERIATRFELDESGDIAGLKVHLNSAQGSPPAQGTFYYQLWSDTGSQNPESGQLLASGSVLIEPLSSGVYDAIFSSPYSATGGTKYWVVFKVSGVSSSLSFKLSVVKSPYDPPLAELDRNSYYNGAWQEYWGGYGASNWFQLLLSPTPKIEIVFPTDSSTHSTDFYNWAVEATPRTRRLYMIAVSYGSTTAVSDHDDYFWGYLSAEQSTTTIAKGYFLENNLVYYAQAYLVNYPQYVIVATSSMISFQTSGLVYGFRDFSGFDLIASTTALSGTTTAARIAAKFQKFGEFKSMIEVKPPLGYYTLIRDIIGSAIQSTTTKAYEMPALSSISFFGNFKNYLSIGFWLLFVFWAFKRFSHIEL